MQWNEEKIFKAKQNHFNTFKTPMCINTQYRTKMILKMPFTLVCFTSCIITKLRPPIQLYWFGPIELSTEFNIFFGLLHMFVECVCHCCFRHCFHFYSVPKYSLARLRHRNAGVVVWLLLLVVAVLVVFLSFFIDKRGRWCLCVSCADTFSDDSEWMMIVRMDSLLSVHQSSDHL